MLVDITSGQWCWNIYMKGVRAAKYTHAELKRFEVSEDETVTGYTQDTSQVETELS